MSCGFTVNKRWTANYYGKIWCEAPNLKSSHRSHFSLWSICQREHLRQTHSRSHKTYQVIKPKKQNDQRYFRSRDSIQPVWSDHAQAPIHGKENDQLLPVYHQGYVRTRRMDDLPRLWSDLDSIVTSKFSQSPIESHKSQAMLISVKNLTMFKSGQISLSFQAMT